MSIRALFDERDMFTLRHAIQTRQIRPSQRETVRQPKEKGTERQLTQEQGGKGNIGIRNGIWQFNSLTCTTAPAKRLPRAKDAS
jgi:hypothetical protein